MIKNSHPRSIAPSDPDVIDWSNLELKHVKDMMPLRQTLPESLPGEASLDDEHESLYELERQQRLAISKLVNEHLEAVQERLRKKEATRKIKVTPPKQNIPKQLLLNFKIPKRQKITPKRVATTYDI